MSAVYFHENDIVDTFTEDIQKIFSREDIIQKIGAEVNVLRYEGTPVDETLLPFISIKVSSSSAEQRYAIADESEVATSFVLACEIYSGNLANCNKQRATILIGEILSSELRGKYKCLTIIANTPLPTKIDIARKLIKFSGVYDNKHNFIYTT